MVVRNVLTPEFENLALTIYWSVTDHSMMTVVYDNWERLVTAVLRREELWLSGLRTPSYVSSLSSASASPSFNFSLYPRQVSSLSSCSLLVWESFTYHQILRATDFLSDSNLIKHGHSGKFFYGVLEGGGGGRGPVVVKKVDLSCLEDELSLMSKLKIHSTLDHSRLIPLLRHCLENGYEQFLVYKYTPNMDLASFLQYNDSKQLQSLRWTLRLKIAIGAAEGLCYLHHECFPPLVHRDVQVSSILLDDDFEVRLGSLTAVCIEEKINNQSKIARFLRLPKGMEQTTSGKSTVRCSYDVYCFGKIFLELVTGKLGISAASDSSMKDWMEKTLRYVVSSDKKLILNIVDNYLIMDEHLPTEVWAVAFIANACVKHKPSKRPQMSAILEALKHLESIRLSNQQFQAPSHPNKFFPAPTMPAVPEGSKTIGRVSQATKNATSSSSSTASGNCEFSEVNANEKVYPLGEVLDSPNLRIFTYLELKAATRNFSKGDGAYGSIYKGSLHEKSMSESGSEALIAVEKVYSWYIPKFQEWWQSEVDLHGRLSHPNIVKLLGYCWENEELLLVYEFMQEGSLENHLFGRRGSVLNSLTWERRIKILPGAALGLEFLHQSQRRGLKRQEKGSESFYGKIMLSNVLLGHSCNAKLSYFGVTKSQLVDPVMFGEVHPYVIWHTTCRTAPEYFTTGKLCMQSDVYSFGILLVEMITGLQALDTNRPCGKEVLVKWIKPHFSDPEKLFNILDSKLKRNCPVKAVAKVSKLALLCLEKDPEYRPSMEVVVKVLELIESANRKIK